MEATRRSTKYTQAVLELLQELGHATNAELHRHIQRTYPDVSSTTIHRVTQRLYDDGNIGQAPSASDGAMRYDKRVDEHDHFECSACGTLQDIAIPDSCRCIIQRSVGLGCDVRGPLYISGVCKQCQTILV